MKLHYDNDTDSLYIDLSSRVSANSEEISDGLIADYDEAGSIVGIDIQHASQRIDLSSVETTHLPLVAKTA
jgi:uncharacterized protein YuzE